MIVWQFLHPQMTINHLGFIKDWLSELNPADAVEQIDRNYRHGGGWFDCNGFKMRGQGVLFGAGDPPLWPLAKTHLRNETIYFYQHAWVAVVQPNGSYRVARID